MSRQVKDPKKENPLEILPPWFETGVVTALLVPLLYTTGWSYAYHYFERFSLGLMGLEIPREYFFVYGFQAIQDQVWLFLLTVIGFVTVLVFGRVFLERKKKKFADQSKARMLNVIPASLLPVLIFGLFFAWYHLGEKAAGNVYDRQVQHDFDAYLRVQVWVHAPEQAEYRDEMAKAWQKGCYRLLMRNQEHLFVFHPLPSGGKIPTDMIPSGQVDIIRMLPVNTSCP